MTITQLLAYVALTAGILLYAALAVVPLVVEHEARKEDRAVPGTSLPAPGAARRLAQPEPEAGMIRQAA